MIHRKTTCHRPASTLAVSTLATLAALAWAGAATSGRPQPDLEKQFAGTVRPFVQAYCAACHGGEKAQAQLDLSAYTSLASVLRDAYAADPGNANDCASLVERRGGRIKVVPGDRRLLKVTDRHDLELVESWLAEAKR